MENSGDRSGNCSVKCSSNCSTRWCALLLWGWLLFGQTLHAAAPQWDELADTLFRHWSMDQGLPHPDVMSIAQDRAGFLWLGTQGGLARWDGYRFRIYQPDPNDVASVPDNYIQTLFVDARSRLWVGTNGAGLARYDDESDRFVRIPMGVGGIRHVHILAMADDGVGGLWVGTRGGLDHISPEGKVLPRSTHQSKSPNPLGSDVVSALLRDRDGNLWIGTDRGLVRQDKQLVQVIEFEHAGQHKPGIVTLKQSQDGRIWIGTRDQGVFWLEPNLHQPAQALAEPGKDEIWQHANIQAMQEVVPGQLWLGSTGHGILVVNTQTLQTKRVRHEAGLPTSLPDNSVWSMWRDRAGLLWIGTQRGLSQYDPSQNAILNLLSNGSQNDSQPRSQPRNQPGNQPGNQPNRIAESDITAVTAMPDGSIWLGLLSQGIQVIHPGTHSMTWWQVDGHHPQSALPPDRIYAMTTPWQGWAYLATDRGLYRVNPLNGKVQRVQLGAFAPGSSVRSLSLNGQVLWLGNEDGLWRLSLDAKHGLSAVRPPGTEELSRQIITVVQADAAGALWIGTRHNGLYRYDPVAQQLRHIPVALTEPDGFSHPFVSSILIDRRGWLWVGTQGGGINLWTTPAANGVAHFTKISVRQGLPNMLVDKLLEDNAGNIWASTDAGLALIEAQSLKVRALQKSEGGAIRVYWLNAGVKTADGQLLFGGAGGLSVVRPELLGNWQFQPRVVVSNLVLGAKPMGAGRINYLGSGAERLQIRPQANSLALEFSSLDYSAPEQNQYRYRLDGFDADWNETDATRRLAAYTNLAPGDYTLRLRGSNRNGVWNTSDLLIPIQVLPAWYQSWWWYGGVLSALLLAAYVLVQVRTRYLRQQQNELQWQVWQRTDELHQNQEKLVLTNQELQQANVALNDANSGLADSVKNLHLAQAQLVQQEKLASLGTLTAGIAHEINNPANFAHVGVYVLGVDLQDLHQFLLHLAGEDASPEVLALLQQRFDKLNQSLATINEGTSRIRDLVRDLRTFSRLDEADWKVVAIGDSLLATANLVRTQFADQLEIRCELAANPELACWPAQLNQVFMNLIVNACQAIVARPEPRARQQPGLLQIRSYEAAQFLVLEFADNGIGIPGEIVERIFDPFFTTKGVGEGMGMGLAISFGIITKHRGSMTVESTEGVGTCFTLRLPLTQSAPEANAV